MYPPSCAACGAHPSPWEHLWWLRELREYLCDSCKVSLRLWQDFNPAARSADWLALGRP